ncbi:MAG: F0F1 ATP synthase subunit A [Phycisphaerales bacterium]
MSLSLLTTLAEGNNPVNHVVNFPFLKANFMGMENAWVWSAHVGTLVLSGIITLIVMSAAAAGIKTGPERLGVNRYVTLGRFAHFIEVICLYLRDTTVRPLLGDRTDKFMPILWTFFFFILVNNILGLIPIVDFLHVLNPAWAETHSAPFGGTPTNNIWVTATLAILAALVVNIAGVKELGIGGYVSHLTAGTPWYLWALMVPIEIMGTLIKPVALALRLFANMTAGHVLVAVLFMFLKQGLDMLLAGSVGGLAIGGGVAVASGLAAVAIYFLELFVAFLQAFVFMFLTTVFISQLAHHDEHGHHEGHDHEHAHAHAH